MVIEVKGRIEFEPVNVTKKHEKQHSWKRVAMILTDCDMHLYYAWFLRRRFDLVLNKPVRGSHLTFISDKVDDRELYDKAIELYNGKTITFYIDPEPRSNGEHWWLRAYSPEAEDIRVAAGLERVPYFAFHYTLGYANEKNIDHSRYILENCKRFELISNSPRKELEEHQIIRYEI